MHYAPTRTLSPINRFRELLGSLNVNQATWGDAFWLRFAAQVVALDSEPPAAIAQRIHDTARILHDHSTWYEALGSSLRFVVAALLVQADIRPQAFLNQHLAILEHFRQAGIRHDGVYATMAILVLRLSAKGRRHITAQQIARLKAIYDELKKFHWWLTGPDDLPACAALAHCTGTPAALAKQVEECYQWLINEGLEGGDPLQTTACILQLGGNEPTAEVQRYLALKRALEAGGLTMANEHYDALAILTLIDQDPAPLIEHLRMVDAELCLEQPSLTTGVRIKIAADLVALDLIRLDHDFHPIIDPAGLKRVRAALHTFYVAATVLISQAEIDRQEMADGMAVAMWP